MIPPHPAPKEAAPDFDKLLSSALDLAQHGLDHAMQWPRWTAFALLGFAAALLLLGRHGQRLLAGATLGGAVVAVALLFFRKQAPNADWPGLTALIGGGAGLALGLGAPRWTTALIASLGLGAAGGLAAAQLGLPWLGGALPFALLGLFLGLANHLTWGLFLPPLAAAFATVTACARLLARPDEKPLIPQLATAPWALATFGILGVMLVALSLERDHLRKKRAANRSKAKQDEALKKKLAKDRERHERYLGNQR